MVCLSCHDVDKIYAIVLVKHPDGSGTIYPIRAPKGISETVTELAGMFPEAKLRVMERVWQKDYFCEENIHQMW